MMGFIDETDFAFRAGAYGASLLIMCSTKFMGGSWEAFILGILVVFFLSRILSGKPSKSYIAKRCQAALMIVRSLPILVRSVCALFMIGIAVTIDFYFGGFALGRAYNIFLVPIFLSSLFFGTLTSAMIGSICVLALDYLAIPPRFSFAINTFEDFWYIVFFAVLALLAILIPELLIKSSVLNDEERQARLFDHRLRM